MVTPVLMNRCTAGNMEITGAYESLPTLRTSRDDVHKVDARRELEDEMYGQSLISDLPDMFSDAAASTYHVIHDKGLYTCIEQALEDGHELIAA